MFLASVFVLAQAAAPPAAETPKPLQPGQEFFWHRPCTVVEPDPANRMEYWASGFLTLVGRPQRVIRCVQSPGGSSAVMLSQVVADVGFLLVYSAEMDEEGFPDLARKGLVAHEVAHESSGQGCNGLLHREQTREEKVGCEAEVDAAAARLAGTDAVRAALDEYHRLNVRLVSANLTRAREELTGLRRNLLDAANDAVPAPVDESLTEVARDIVATARLPYEVTVHVPPLWRARGIVNATTAVRGNRVFIRVSPILAEEMDAPGRRAMIAHELAHPQGGCAPDPTTLEYASREAEVGCEHRADALSARWVGRTTALRGLLQLMHIGWDWRFTTDASGILARIKLLHDRSDIP